MLCFSFPSIFCPCRSRRALNTYVSIKGDVGSTGVRRGVLCPGHCREGGRGTGQDKSRENNARHGRQKSCGAQYPTRRPSTENKASQLLFAKYHCQSLTLGRGWEGIRRHECVFEDDWNCLGWLLCCFGHRLGPGPISNAIGHLAAPGGCGAGR